MWKWIKVASAIVFAIVAVIVVLLISMGGSVHIDDDWSLSGSLKGIVFSIEDDAGGNTLKALLKKAAIEFSKEDFEHIDQEGNRPDITIATIDLPLDRKNVIEDLRKACEGTGLSELEVINTGSSRICRGSYRQRRSVTVDAKLTCKDRCRLVIEVYTI
jgi:hypothetical protein